MPQRVTGTRCAAGCEDTPSGSASRIPQAIVIGPSAAANRMFPFLSYSVLTIAISG
jgi:hypothetical protein